MEKKKKNSLSFMNKNRLYLPLYGISLFLIALSVKNYYFSEINSISEMEFENVIDKEIDIFFPIPINLNVN